MIRVKCILHSYLSKFADDGNPIIEVELDDNSNAIDLLEKIGVPMKKARLIFINGVQKKKSTVLENDDEIKVVPFVPGG